MITKGRGGRPLPSENPGVAQASALMTALLPGLMQSSTHADVSASMSMSMWGVAADQFGAVVRGFYKADSKAKDFLDDLAKLYEEINAAAPLIAATKAVVESVTAAMTSQ